jgi:hypothetical protein
MTMLAYGCSYQLLLKQQFWFTNNLAELFANQQCRYERFAGLFVGAI